LDKAIRTLPMILSAATFLALFSSLSRVTNELSSVLAQVNRGDVRVPNNDINIGRYFLTSPEGSHNFKVCCISAYHSVVLGGKGLTLRIGSFERLSK
jgi:hypothetical protein